MFSGLDFAHCKNGYVYHTRYDRHDMILPSVYQHTGDNLLALVRHIVASEQLKRPNEFKNGRQVTSIGVTFGHCSLDVLQYNIGLKKSNCNVEVNVLILMIWYISKILHKYRMAEK